MDNKFFLSIAIPTWNRASYLKNLLDNIVPQARGAGERVQICISNNGSTDNTREVVMKFKEEYPDLIKYNENKENLGGDVNILKVIEMSEGDFVWTFGDDDNMVKNGLKDVINFLKNKQTEDVGLIVAKTESYFFDEQTGKKIVYYSSLVKDQTESYEIDRRDIIGLSFPDIVFISGLIFNNRIVKKVLAEDRDMIQKGIGIGGNIHVLLYGLMFSKYPNIKGVAFNKIIVCQELPHYKFFIEDRFKAQYKMAKKLWHLMMSVKYMDKDYISLFVRKDKSLRRAFIVDMMVLRTFNSFNYFSYLKCIKIFFSEASLIDAILFSFVFSVLFLTPPPLLRFMYKILLVIRYGRSWRDKWQLIENITSRLSAGTRRQIVWGPS